jgi:hypothetical protein
MSTPNSTAMSWRMSGAGRLCAVKERPRPVGDDKRDSVGCVRIARGVNVGVGSPIRNSSPGTMAFGRLSGPRSDPSSGWSYTAVNRSASRSLPADRRRVGAYDRRARGRRDGAPGRRAFGGRTGIDDIRWVTATEARADTQRCLGPRMATPLHPGYRRVSRAGVAASASSRTNQSSHVA